MIPHICTSYTVHIGYVLYRFTRKRVTHNMYAIHISRDNMPPSRNIIPIIMAGGQGTRMNSDLPKVLHLVNGVPMIVRILRAARAPERD